VTYLYCWGANGFGQLGLGDYNNTHHTPQLVGLVNVVQIALGLEHMCAATNDGSLHCWGANFDGQIGIGTSGSYETTPKPVTSLTGVTKVAAGTHFSCAYGKVGTVQGVYCWGKNDVGQLGTGEAGVGYNSVSPIKVIGLPAAGVESLSAGDAHACAIFDNGEVYCWGANEQMQLGTGSTNAFEHTPAKLTHGFIGAPLLDISAGGWHTCLRGNTTVECWGGNFAGQLGNGVPGGPEQTPVKAGDATQFFLSVDSGGQHTCASNELATGVLCWGANTFVQLGTGDQTPSADPVNVPLPGGTSVFLVAAGGESGDVDQAPPNGHTCVTTHAGPIYCWGHNNFGQLGDGKDVKSAVPVKVLW
jgi:alpha-tubulin suppressor-like RCC1 family protein